MLPGDFVSTDQFECRVKRRLLGSKGKEDPSKIYSGGTVFVDHASSTIIIYNQVSLGTSDNVRSKELYELWAAENEVSVKYYRGDNFVYKSKVFMDDLKLSHQNMSYSGVGAHRKMGWPKEPSK